MNSFQYRWLPRWLPITAALIGTLATSAGAQNVSGRVTQSGALVNVGSRLCADVAPNRSREGGNVQLGDCRSGLADWDVVEGELLEGCHWW